MKRLLARFLVFALAAALTLQGAQAGGFGFRFAKAGGNATPSLSLDFTTGVADSRLTISGGAGGTRVNSSGNIVSASAPRFDYDPITLAAKGLLVEEQRTNLFIQSGSIGTAPWAAANATITTGSKAAPDGTTSESLLVSGNTLAGGRATAATVAFAAGTTYTASVWIEPAGRTSWTILIPSNPWADATARIGTFTLTGSGSASATGTGATAAIEAWPGGRYRCKLTFTPDTSASAGVQLRDPATGDGVNGVYVWGAQLEAGSFATSYIPTTTAQVTRTADSEVMASISSWFNSNAGTIYAEYDLTGLYASGTNQNVLALTNGGSSDRMFIYRSVSGNSTLGQVDAGSVNQLSVGSAGALAINTIRKSSLAYAAADFAFSENGLAPTTQSSGSLPTGLNALNIGVNSAGTGAYLNGHIRRIRYYPTRLPNAQLQVLTQ
jgi:hypothetical protein